MSKLLDDKADVLPYGLQVTPFGDVWRALQAVAASVWSVDPTVYRSGVAWGWYVLHNPAVLESQRDLVIAALISEQAPLVKADQTDAELVEYLRQWRDFRPTYDRLEALYKLFAADVEILPISTPGAPTVEDSRLAYYVRIYGVDFNRLLTLDEARTIALRVSPLGSRPIVYYDLEEDFELGVYPLRAGISAQNWENDAICEPFTASFFVYDTATNSIVNAFGNELHFGDVQGFIMQNPPIVFDIVPFDIDTTYGTQVTIPPGYTVESVKSQRLFLKASSVTGDPLESPIDFEFSGENKYCNDDDPSIVTLGVNPCLSLFALTRSDSGIWGFWVSYRSQTTPSVVPSLLSISDINSSGYFLKGRVLLPNSSDNAGLKTGMINYPVLFRRYDENGNFILNYFKIPQTLWQFQDGVFSWLGDPTDTSTPAYWYTYQASDSPIRIHCVPITA